MRVEILHIDKCPNWVEAGRRVRAGLDEAGLGAVKAESVLVTTAEEAARLPFGGSPTILLDGVDAFPEGARTAELACRVYRTENGFAGVPSVEQILAAIRQRL